LVLDLGLELRDFEKQPHFGGFAVAALDPHGFPEGGADGVRYAVQFDFVVLELYDALEYLFVDFPN
jgi:hypothetical protein